MRSGRCVRWFVFALIVSCGADTSQPTTSTETLLACEPGDVGVGVTATFYGFEVAVQGQAAVTSVDPLTLALDSGTVTISGLQVPLSVGAQVDLTLTGDCPLWCGYTAIANDNTGLLFAAWDADLWNPEGIADWSLSYNRDACTVGGGCGGVSMSLAATHSGGATVELPAGTTAQTAGYDVVNGQSTEKEDLTCGLGKSPTRRHRGGLLRRSPL